MSQYITSLEELKQEGERKKFLAMLPMLFKQAEVNPALNPEIFEHGAASGLTKDQIEAERSKWKKANSQKP
ncbi:MAG: hypothetical protein LBE49_09100 [Deltaproteobacteria bacterium]|jgi:Tfp pilus assembly protein PilO|nr:hypothetical protein [Deltaproteobacteria bacterium]